MDHYVAANMDVDVAVYVDNTWMPTWMTRGTYVDNDVAPVDDDVAPMWTMTWHLCGRWRDTYMDDDVSHTWMMTSP
jgi:hypothetical protein